MEFSSQVLFLKTDMESEKNSLKFLRTAKIDVAAKRRKMHKIKMKTDCLHSNYEKGEIKMQLKTGLRLVVLFAVTLCWIFPAAGQVERETDLRSSYEKMFEDFVKKTESKVKMSGSKSKNLRRTAHISSLKTEYLKNHKNALIAEMIQNNIPLKNYRISRFLNDRFFTDYASKPALNHQLVKITD